MNKLVCTTSKLERVNDKFGKPAAPQRSHSNITKENRYIHYYLTQQLTKELPQPKLD